MSRSFRNTYLNYEQLTATLEDWVRDYPGLAHLQSIGTTDEGRELWLLTVGPEPERIRPAVWIDGNMHAAELCGSSVALSIAEDMLRLHAEGHSPQALSAAACAALEDVLFYVLPRFSPDGAEQVLEHGRFVRSNLRDDRPDRSRSYWRTRDVNGDGLALAMRVRDEAGESVESGDFPNLMLPRSIDDEGPFYKIYPEGIIENFDGKTIPSPSFFADAPVDLNRNFPWGWAPEHEQIGAGAFPGSEPESRAVIEFTSGRPNIFAWLNLHTFGGVGIRPLGDAADSKMDQEDLAIYRQVGQWLEEHAGYPMVSGFEEFTYEPEKPIRGDLTDYAYHQRGCISWVVELWDLFARMGLERKKPFVKSYSDLSARDMVALAEWDRDHNQSRTVVPWQKFDHPQLGEVEIGGIDARVGMWNPPYEALPEICNQQSAAFLRVAAMSPRVQFSDVTTTQLGGGVSRIDITVENLGYLPTYVLNSAKKLGWNEAPYLELEPDGVELVEGASRRPLGHLDGWGRGAGGGVGVLYFAYGRGNTGSAMTSVLVRGTGAITACVRACRMGEIRRTIPVS